MSKPMLESFSELWYADRMRDSGPAWGWLQKALWRVFLVLFLGPILVMWVVLVVRLCSSLT